MTIVHIVQFALKPSLSEDEVQDTCEDMLSLKDNCIHPSTQKPYILALSGGKNNSPEGFNDGLTHGFVVEFATAEDRDYYIFKDPAHQEFVKKAPGRVDKIVVVDYESGMF